MRALFRLFLLLPTDAISAAVCADLWKRPLLKDERELDTAEMCRVIDGYSRIGATGIGFTGGEPLLRTDIMELVRRAKRRRLIAHIATNAILLDEAMASELISSGLDAVIVSLDGPIAATHDRIRGSEGAFEKAIAGMKAFVKVRKERKAKIAIT